MKPIALTFVLLVLALSNVVTIEVCASQSPAMRAFTITRRIYSRRDDGRVTEEGTEVEYRDREGNVRKERRDRYELITNPLLITGRDKDVGWYSVGQGEQQDLYMKGCPEPSEPPQSFEQLRTRSDFVREEQLFGFRAAVLRPPHRIADFYEVWIVPELDGVEVKRIIHWPDADVYFISEATSITVGEPSNGLARLPRGLKEGRDVCKEMPSFPIPRPICP